MKNTVALFLMPFNHLISQFAYEDSMDLIAKLPCIAAKIYRNLYREGSSIGAIDSSLDWSHNFTNMLGYSDVQFTELMRLYLTIHRCAVKDTDSGVFFDARAPSG